MNTHFLILAALITLAAAEIAYIRKCEGVDADACKINQVRITPCGTKQKKKCELIRKETANLNFDFTPNFSASKLKTEVYGVIGGKDEPFTGMGSDNACNYTTCPVEAGKQQTFDYNLYIDKNIPQGTFTIKWKVWNEEEEAQVCCFLTNLRITKKNK